MKVGSHHCTVAGADGEAGGRPARGPGRRGHRGADEGAGERALPTRSLRAARSIQAELQINVVSIYLQFNDEASDPLKPREKRKKLGTGLWNRSVPRDLRCGAAGSSPDAHPRRCPAQALRALRPL